MQKIGVRSMHEGRSEQGRVQGVDNGYGAILRARTTIAILDCNDAILSVALTHKVHILRIQSLLELVSTHVWYNPEVIEHLWVVLRCEAERQSLPSRAQFEGSEKHGRISYNGSSKITSQHTKR